MSAFEALVGDWTTEIKHRLFPDTELRGRSTFELMDGGKFLIQRESMDHPDFPGSSHAVISGDRMYYFDSRGVVRIFTLTIDGSVWTFTRDPQDFNPIEFHQRMTWDVNEGDRTFAAVGEMSEDGGQTWFDDIWITYTRS